MTYRDNKAFQDGLLSVSRPGTLILTSGGRLARLLKHRYRQTQMSEGRQGWILPDILSLNAWIRKAWNLTWPAIHPLSHVSRLALWREAVGRVPPPEPFIADIELFETLDETYAVLARHKLLSQPEISLDTPLLLWRRKAFEVFEELLIGCKSFHPALLPLYLAGAISEGAVELPDAIFLAAFEAPSPVEESLFACLSKECKVIRFDLPKGTPQQIKGVVLQDRRQEAAWLVQQLVADARHITLNQIGVVVPDTETYVPYLKETLAEIVGESHDEVRSAFNISAGTSLLKRSLIQAGLLPLRFWIEGELRAHLLAMLLSPYYGRWARCRDEIARVDLLWRQEGIEEGFRELFGILSQKYEKFHDFFRNGGYDFEATLRDVIENRIRTGAEWVNTLGKFWRAVGFPVISDEADSGAWEHLKNILTAMQEDLRSCSMSIAEFWAFLRHELSRKLVHVRGIEEAGIQVLGLIESRGMSFEKLYVLGLEAKSLPRPVRSLPLLSPHERRHVHGATAESQFFFAREAFDHLLACAPSVTLLRPAEEAAERLAPSPFWSQAVAEETHEVVDFWNAPDPVWARSAWLQGTEKGLESRKVFPPSDPPIKGELLPAAISVSQLSTAFTCSFRFYAETMLKVLPLEEFVAGISPADRGSLLHKTLALFTRRCRENGLMGERDRPAMRELLKECVEEILAPFCLSAGPGSMNAVTPHGWRVEKCRWLGDETGAPGLLIEWLDLELKRLEKGWEWLCEESSFHGLKFDEWPFSVSGRIDRIDRHKEKGLVLWDYKSGEHPAAKAVTEYFADPQIPAYLAASISGQVFEAEEDTASGVPVSGGYIGLKTASAVSHVLVIPKGRTWNEVLDIWREKVALVGKMLASGNFSAEPYPVSDVPHKENACRICPYKVLCGKKEAL